MKSKLFSFMLIVFSMCLSLSVQAQQRLTPKYGYIDWEKRTVNVAGTDIDYKRGSFQPIGVSYGYIFFDRLFVGGEFIFEDLDLTTGAYSNSNDINVYRLNAMVNYYYLTDEFFKPYIGVGYGYAEMGIHAAQNAELRGYTAMGIVGLDMKFSRRLGLSLEYRRAYMSLDDPSNNQLKTLNNEFFVGLNIYFGK